MRHCLACVFAAGIFAVLPGQQVLLTGYGPVANALTGNKVAHAGDLDGDGTTDFLVETPNVGNGRVDVVSGANGSQRFLHNPGTTSFASLMFGCPDLNLDGRADIIVSRNGLLRAHSGSTLALLWETTSPYVLATPIGDRDGDGRTDLAAIVSFGAELRVLRGSNGSVLQAWPLVDGFNGVMVSVGDLDGDGVPEVVRGGSNRIDVLRLGNPTLVLAINQSCLSLSVANFAGDARLEIVAGNAGNAVRILDATNGSVLRTFLDVPGGDHAVIGDIDADGVPDLALRAQAVFPGSVEGARYVSGATGARLSEWPGHPQFRIARLAALGDVNGDGFGDFVNGDTSSNAAGPSLNATGGWRVMSGKILAFRESKAVNCAQGPFQPLIGKTPPVLGSTVLVVGQEAPIGAVGIVAWSLQPSAPMSLGVAGCDAWFDLGGGHLLTTTATAPTWQFTFPLPLIPQLAGVHVAMQAFYAPSSTPIGLDLTNGIWSRLGY